MRWMQKILPKKTKKEGSAHMPFEAFVEQARNEIDTMIQEDPKWFSGLPYGGAMTREQARNLEVEKRALWRRVIYDAKRSKLPGLRWETSRDERVCAECAALEGRVFRLNEYDLLNDIRMHVGCRCNLIPVRSSE